MRLLKQGSPVIDAWDRFVDWATANDLHHKITDLLGRAARDRPLMEKPAHTRAMRQELSDAIRETALPLLQDP
jgi:hypothetical protein